MHTDPLARKEKRYRVNLNYYQSEKVEKAAREVRKQTATYLAEIIDAHLKSLEETESESTLKKVS